MQTVAARAPLASVAPQDQPARRNARRCLRVVASAQRDVSAKAFSIEEQISAMDATTGDFTALHKAVKQMAVKAGAEGLIHNITNPELREVLTELFKKYPDQHEFLQVVREVAVSLQPVFDKRPELLPIFKQIAEPEHVITCRVSWVDDAGSLQVNRGFRVQYSSAIGPYKGGLPFHPSVNLSIMKFLVFEHIFKNSLTTLLMGGGKGGSDFDPKGKSDAEVMRFCQSFMTELHRHISYVQDVPAGDIGVGAREIGYLFGQYKRITKNYTGVLTGKGQQYGGSEIRPEATGYGAVLFVENVLRGKGDTLKGKLCVVSGAGNVAQFCAELLLEKGATVLSLSDSQGYIYKPKGFTREQVDQVMAMKKKDNGSHMLDYKSDTVLYVGDGRKPWEINTEIDIAFPCATQNEIPEEDTELLIRHGCKYVVEGANMPSTNEAIHMYNQAGIVYCPGKAANAGGVAVSGLEMSQNRLGLNWTREEVKEKLERIMGDIYDASMAASKEYGVDLAAGANIAGFLKVAEAVKAQGAV
ncbi:glutamate dehydrogenase isoform A [Micractinium conductrix]|uniref:glutamate dehydrogenase (NADP(+)) n=1 Tax=Micractinium conductrix TaxID=554055 RepID=A0A2P6VBM9_9CHLO|nr:glutamate dehydrogenase isoform A [Micractinium conductrix]|eukprot:PSC71495.1 glutamate dehydrogenase isoform A [Micractinium conductrix]